MTTSSPSVILVELNEASRYFLDKYVGDGSLPYFARLRDRGVMLTTTIPDWDADEARAWRTISPWIVWPSIYTGLSRAAHGIVGFGQDPNPTHRRCVWDVLDEHGISTGVGHSLMSYPPRCPRAGVFYLPDILSEDAACTPASAAHAQRFCVFSARNYSESFVRDALRASALLAASGASGVRAQTMARVLAQIPREQMSGATVEPERALLLSYIAEDVVSTLLRRQQPRFTSLHLNHVAYMQHRYWRAAEPWRFTNALSSTDALFFATSAERRRYEERFSRWVLRSLQYSERLLEHLEAIASDDTIFVVASGLGQRPMDPVHEIHNPVVRLIAVEQLLRALGVDDCRAQHQMNPDLTLTFTNSQRAAAAAVVFEGVVVRDEALFFVERRGRQLFLELLMCKKRRGENPTIHHRLRSDISFPLNRFVEEHRIPDQSTAHHAPEGWLLAYSRALALRRVVDTLPITEIAPTLLGLFGLAPAPWMHLREAGFQIDS